MQVNIGIECNVLTRNIQVIDWRILVGVFWRGLPYFLVERSASLLSAKALAIETGTYLGDSTEVLSGFFEHVVTIERDEKLAKNALNRFIGKENIKVHLGNSAEILCEITPQNERPVLFWLDAHFSGGVTAGEEYPCPLLDELAIISKLREADNTIVLIDDARALIGLGGWPTIDQVCRLFDLNKWSFTAIDDVMICTNRSYIELLVNEPDKSSRLFDLERLAGEWLSIRRVMTLTRSIAAVRNVGKRVKSRALSLVGYMSYFPKQSYYFFKRLFV